MSNQTNIDSKNNNRKNKLNNRRDLSYTKKLAFIAMFTALALICSYIESLIPFNFGVPGMKLGLTNIVVIITLYTLGPLSAFIVSIIRVFLAGFMFGNAFSIIYSLAGACLSFFVMWLLKKINGLSVILISSLGGIFHNLGQVIVAAIIVENYHLLYYFFILMITGALTGLLIGFIAKEILRRLPKNFGFDS